MKLIKNGKTKDVYALDNGNFLLKFDDRVTGGPQGEVDPGGNLVVGKVAGMGEACLSMTTYLFKKIMEHKIIDTHMVAYDLNEKTMEVKPASLFGAGLEIIIRFVATGSFVRRYGEYTSEGQVFADPLVEITLKNDALGDPLINDEAIVALKLLSETELNTIKKSAKSIARLIKEELSAKGLTIYDMKMEFGKSKNGEIMLIDEISPGSMRVFKGTEKIAGPNLSEYFK